MRICLFIGSLSGGGAERVTCNLANYLIARNHQVTVLTMSDDYPTYRIDERIRRETLISKKERKGFLYNSLIRFFRFCKFLKNNDFEVYIVMLPITIIMLLLMKRLTKAKIIASERVDPSVYPYGIKISLRKLAHRADGWVFQTIEECRWYGDRVANSYLKIIPNAINSDFVKPPYEGERRKLIVTAGRLSAQKNHVLLLKAFARIHSSFPDYHLIIYGEGPMRNDLEILIEKMNLMNHVILPGYITDLGNNIKDSSLFVLSSDYEGMPNVLMEAMALGVPCISTDCDGGGARFLIDNEKNGLLVPKGDVDALATAIERILSDRGFAEQCGREAHKICERLAPEKIYGEWESFIKEIKMAV